MRVQDDQLEHYRRELSYLRTQSANFAARYPKLARRLVLTDAESADPHIQHLIESVAFLTAGVIIGSKSANLSPLFDTPMRREFVSLP